MNNYKLLSIDETGKASYHHNSKTFILSGVIIPETLKPKIDQQMRKIKSKYFNSDEIVFHSRDMARRKGPFAALRDTKIESKFWAEFVSIVNNSSVGLLFVITNKDKAKKL